MGESLTIPQCIIFCAPAWKQKTMKSKLQDCRFLHGSRTAEPHTVGTVQRSYVASLDISRKPVKKSRKKTFSNK